LLESEELGHEHWQSEDGAGVPKLSAANTGADMALRSSTWDLEWIDHLI
jgi:hypothetical protein